MPKHCPVPNSAFAFLGSGWAEMHRLHQCSPGPDCLPLPHCPEGARDLPGCASHWEVSDTLGQECQPSCLCQQGLKCCGAANAQGQDPGTEITLSPDGADTGLPLAHVSLPVTSFQPRRAQRRTLNDHSL